MISVQNHPRRPTGPAMKAISRGIVVTRMPLPGTAHDKEALLLAANLLRSMGASEVFVFGSFVKGELRPDSDIDIAVSGLPASVYFSAVSKVSDILRRPADLVDLDDDTPMVRRLIDSGELVHVA